MIELNVNNLVKYYGADKLFENISLEIKTGEKIGLIGQNGCGKSTLMKILMGEEEYQSGEISLRKENKLGYLNQIPVYEKSASVLEVLRLAFEPVNRLRREMEDLEERMGQQDGEELQRVMGQYARLLEKYEHMHGYDIETRIDKVTEGLQIDAAMKEMPFERLSGGEKTRVILAKILLEEPDILLLDEPTNHLDLVTIEWLESFLKNYQGAALIISHDRHFLDTVVGRIYELELDHMEEYPGNYSYYVTEKERRFLVEYRNYQNQQKKIARMEKQIERYRIWGVMRDSEVMYKRAKELEKRLEKIEVLDRPVLEKRKIRLKQTAVGRSGKIAMELGGVGLSYGQRELLREIDLVLYYQDSACIIGENGSGKTTLLKLILGQLEPTRGSVRLGASIKIGYLPQHVEYPDEEQTVLEYFSRLHDLPQGAARSQLAKVLFLQEDVNKKIKFLSGGEKSRLRLCSLTFEGANLLLLDEPTNHLDVDSREVLEETLADYEGTMLFVSHDRYFIRKLADKVIVLQQGRTRLYDGDYDYYLEESSKEKEEKPVQRIPRNEPKEKTVRTGTQEKNRAGKQSGRRLEELEEVIGELEAEEKALGAMMEEYNTDEAKLNELYHRQCLVKSELESAYAEWEIIQLAN
ncbi:ATPase subunit of ABC transporter with duplicated ATPase domains [Anaerotaenia torta]|uniref:ribosomal protection-like ABC-F family protein n=1 Tax=Anaerotaenia torta TaxID=433293 RepID=UPI003D234684